MMRLLLIGLLVLSGISCKSKSAPVSTDLQMVQGDWVMAGFKTDPTATGKLTLKEDYSFTGSMGSTKGNKPHNETLSGKFALSRTAMTGENILFVDLKITTLSGKPAGPGMGMRLSYDPKQNVLTDLLIMIYARPSELAQVKAMMAKQRQSFENRQSP